MKKPSYIGKIVLGAEAIKELARRKSLKAKNLDDVLDIATELRAIANEFNNTADELEAMTQEQDCDE